MQGCILHTIQIQQQRQVLKNINQIAMQTNQSDDCQHFLQWVNMERLEMGENIPWYSLSQVKDGQFLQAVLYKLNPDFFQQLLNVAFHYSTYLTKIQQYLDKFHGQKIKRSLRNSMLDQQSPKNLLKIIFYICIQSSSKNEFIHRVFQLSGDTQGHLMHSIKNIQENIQNTLEIKDILSKLQQLEDENDNLKDKIKQNEILINTLKQTIKQNDEEYHKVINERNKLKKQKDIIMQLLGLSEINQYIMVYRQIKNQNEQLLDSLQNYQHKLITSQQNCKQLKQKIKQDCLVIQHLSAEISKLKTNYQYAWLEMSYYQQKSDYSPLKQNTGRDSSNQSKSFVKINKNGINYILDNQESQENDKLRYYNAEIIKKIQQMYKKINTMNQQIEAIKEQKQLISKQNEFNLKIISELKNAYENFVNRYSLTILE